VRCAGRGGRAAQALCETAWGARGEAAQTAAMDAPNAPARRLPSRHSFSLAWSSLVMVPSRSAFSRRANSSCWLCAA
jgi:hypothetical protein